MEKKVIYGAASFVARVEREARNPGASISAPQHPGSLRSPGLHARSSMEKKVIYGTACHADRSVATDEVRGAQPGGAVDRGHLWRKGHLWDRVPCSPLRGPEGARSAQPGEPLIEVIYGEKGHL
jgi:hypothetical protein